MLMNHMCMYVNILLDFNGTISGRHLNLEGGQVAAQPMQSQAEEIVHVIQQLHQKGGSGGRSRFFTITCIHSQSLLLCTGEQLRALKSPMR